MGIAHEEDPGGKKKGKQNRPAQEVEDLPPVSGLGPDKAVLLLPEQVIPISVAMERLGKISAKLASNVVVKDVECGLPGVLFRGPREHAEHYFRLVRNGAPEIKVKIREITW